MFEGKVNLFLLFEILSWLHFYPAQCRRVKNWLTATGRAGIRLPKSSQMLITAEISMIAQK